MLRRESPRHRDDVRAKRRRRRWWILAPSPVALAARLARANNSGLCNSCRPGADTTTITRDDGFFVAPRSSVARSSRVASSPRMWITGPLRRARIGFVVVVFLLLAVAILSRPEKWVSDFGQSLYLTIAYDLVHHGVFSNGVLDDIDSTTNRPQPGRFFGPAYPWLIVVAMKLDPRFARAVDCVVEADHGGPQRLGMRALCPTDANHACSAACSGRAEH